ncbi:type II toxin-antitoxin system RelB/DinJ family antitoxin [Burkholderia multivorans]|uniref:type II toxin-antitoxin system RelB/DinJ family antitoxin n=1 Tax=Burkholderia multivorans TaxID=87883 RepID=UPI0009BD2E55|nr:type II toxin-antitoxin system RelB/DinJ family antitoxin [Burkholderia multivorans]
MYATQPKSADVRIRLEPELKEEAARVLADNGLTVSDAMRLFLRKVVAVKGLPFDVRVPNAVTLEAMAETEARKGGARFSSAKELFDELEEKTSAPGRKPKAGSASQE